MKRSNRYHRRQTLLSWLAVVLIALLQVQLLPTMSVNDSQSVASNTDPAKAAVEANYGRLPLAFEPNQGQVDGTASFLVHHGKATTYFDGANTTTSIGDDHITMSLDGANTPNFTGTDQLESKTNYFIGNDKSKWQSNVPNFKNLLAKNVYPGIDLKYYGTNSQLEHDFIVSPGTDYKQIAFHFDGQENLSLDKDGNLVMKTKDLDLKLNAPITYQQTSNTKHTIPSQFELKDNTVTIALNADYDHSQSLIIDPVLIYSTYLGGSGNDFGRAIAIDSSGNAYVSGSTTSTNFPTASPFQGSFGGAQDAFVSKFNATGSALVYSTYLGGNNTDVIYHIAVDSSGNAYVSGATTSSNFPTVSPIQGSNAGGFGSSDAFVSKFNAAGSALTYSTYLGGTGAADVANGISVDATGNAYVVGTTNSTNFPTVSAFQVSKNGAIDAFISKLNSTGSALTYSTYLGGSGVGNDTAYGVAVDSSGNAYVTGFTSTTDFPTVSPIQGSNASNDDAFISKFNATGSALIYSTYLGGSGSDFAYGVAVDSSGNVYLDGKTDSTNFPTASSFQPSNGGGITDAFITKIDATGSALVYSTYLGGNGEDSTNSDIVLDSSGNVYVAGYTTSTNFPTVSAFQVNNAGSSDAFITKFNVAGSALVYSTYLGGTGFDQIIGSAVGLNGNVYVSGATNSTNFPTSVPFQASNGGGFDAFIMQLTEHSVNLTAQVDPTLSFTVGSTSCVLGALSVSQTQQCTYALTASTNGTSGYTISYLPVATLTSGANTITALSALTASTLNAEQFGINLRANTAIGSHTASAFGADVSGGAGVVASAYNTANSFKLVAAGDTVSSSPSPSLTSTYTVSTIANIGSTTEAGAYTTTLTYNIVAGY